MDSIPPVKSPSETPTAKQRLRERREVSSLWRRVPVQAGRAGNLFECDLGQFRHCGAAFGLQKFVFIGSSYGDLWLRLGIFAGIHGDEPAGSLALVELIEELHDNPLLAQGLELHIYPVCNPSGYEDGTRWARGGPDLNREFWKNSSEPEVSILENEIRRLRFDGLVSIHADDTTDGVYGYVGGDVLTRNLLEPALVAASEFLPRCRNPLIDGWSASDAIIQEHYEGILRAPESQHPHPFEIIFETLGLASVDLQVSACRAALLAIFTAALQVRSYAANI